MANTRISAKVSEMNSYNIDQKYNKNLKKNTKTGTWSITLSDIPMDRIKHFIIFYEDYKNNPSKYYSFIKNPSPQKEFKIKTETEEQIYNRILNDFMLGNIKPNVLSSHDIN